MMLLKFKEEVIELFPKSRFQKVSDITEETINFNIANFEAYAERYDFVDFVKSREKVIKKARQMVKVETEQEGNFVTNGAN